MLRAGADADGVIKKGLRPLHYAAHVDNVDAITTLISHGGSVNGTDDVGYTPLHIACKSGHIRSCQRLIEQGACVDFSGESAGTSIGRALSDLTVNPLSLALENDYPEIAELCLQNGANANQKYFLGHEVNLIPLENWECLDVLLKYGANPDVVSRGGLTALTKACRQQHLKAVQVLLKHGASVNLQCPPRFEEKTALHFCAISCNEEITRLLLEAGANTKCPDDFQYSALEYAISQDKLGVCKILLEYGADPNELNENNVSPLQTACTTPNLAHRVEIIETLLKHNADPNFHARVFSSVCPTLCPIVEYFAYSELEDDFDEAVIRILLKYGANVNLRLPTRLFRVKDGGGILNQIHKLVKKEQLFNLIIGAAEYYDFGVIENSVLLNCPQKQSLKEISYPRPLRHLIRLSIRSIIRKPIPDSVECLPLPTFLKDYLMFNV